MTAFQPTPADFLPLAAIEVATYTRPPRSYWQDVWSRLARNTSAVVSLLIITALLLFTLIGPSLWSADPSIQVLDQVSQPPNLGRSALLVADHQRWGGARISAAPADPDTTVALTAPARLALLGKATTEGVRLTWTPVAGATGYAVYRHEFRPRDSHDLGLPLAETSATNVGYEDRLGLEARSYSYSIVALRGADPGTAYRTLDVPVHQALSLSEARLRGLIEAAAGPESTGTRITLAAHPLGTDYLGRDMLARILRGARTSLFIGICAPLCYVLFGLLYGGAAGYFGGAIDNALMRVADFAIALPFLLFMILFKVAFGIGPGESGVMPMLVALILLGWPLPARLVRAEVMRVREQPHVLAARLMGASGFYLLWRHLLPGCTGVLLVALSFAIPGAIFTEAFLSFIGMGVVPPNPSWGSICNDGLRSMLAHPHELIVPAAFISITVLAFNLLGDGLRDAMDTRGRSDR